LFGALARLVFLNILGNLILAPFALLSALRSRPRWARIDVKEPLPARPARRGLRRGPSLARLAEAIDALARDRRIDGVVVTLGPLAGGWAKAQSLRGVLARLPRHGKRLVVHLSSPGMREYYVATAADTIAVDESGPVSLVGLAAEVTFFGGAFAKVGVEAQAEYRGKYKSFAETFTRADMSPAHREAVDALLDDVHADVVAAVAAARGLDRDRAASLVAGGPHTPAAAAAAGLVDHVAYIDELEDRLEVKLAPYRRGVRLRWRPLVRRRSVRILSLHGTIVPGEGAGLPRRAVAADAAVRALAAARADRRVGAVVLHIDSRGGSAAASDLIWHEAARVAKKKPVVAYMEDAAASGGYYIACAAKTIVAQPGTLTGSIGVVAGKLALAGLYERLGLHTVTLVRGEAAAMNSAAHPYSDEERRRLVAEVDALYAQFVGKVAAGRGLSVDEVEAAAAGRVWSGRAAHARKLVDVLGDVDDAVRAAEGLARRRPGERFDVDDVAVRPRRRGILALLPTAVADVALLAGERALLYAPDVSVS
jgi:protease-4